MTRRRAQRDRPYDCGVNTTLIALLTALVAAVFGGCGSQQRTITVTSEPPGAVCYLNDVEIGRTPCDTEFKFFGVYDVRLIADGFEPLATSADTAQPFAELPGIDLLAGVLPGQRVTDIRWHYVLTPAAGVVDRADRIGRAKVERALVDRAAMMRSEAEADAALSPPTPVPAPAVAARPPPLPLPPLPPPGAGKGGSGQ